MSYITSFIEIRQSPLPNRTASRKMRRRRSVKRFSRYRTKVCFIFLAVFFTFIRRRSIGRTPIFSERVFIPLHNSTEPLVLRRFSVYPTDYVTAQLINHGESFSHVDDRVVAARVLAGQPNHLLCWPSHVATNKGEPKCACADILGHYFGRPIAYPVGRRRLAVAVMARNLADAPILPSLLHGSQRIDIYVFFTHGGALLGDAVNLIQYSLEKDTYQLPHRVYFLSPRNTVIQKAI